MEVVSHLTEKAQRDYALVIRARQNGDQHAYAELMRNYQDTLYYIMLRMTSNPTDAEDLTIEAFGRAFRNLENYTTDYAFSTWLFKIAANNCIDFLRKSKRINFTNKGPDSENGETESQNIPCTEPDPEEQIIEKQRIMLLREVVDKMKPHYRKLVELRYFKEWSYEEIATELNLPLGTVKAKLFRSRDLLQQVLKSKMDHI
jgi:RNA polymerase sigma-70 factor (ECF subfamily)